jgi:hypothetical protein
MLNPALHRHPLESLIIGQLILSYGELELLIAFLLGNAINNRDAALKMMFRVVGESARIGAADAMMRDAYSAAGLADQYAEVIGAVRFCVRVRNQFAHCHWGDDFIAGLFFTDLQEPAKASEGFEHYWHHIDGPLALKLQEYFEYTLECLRFVEYEFVIRTKKIECKNPFLKLSRLSPPNLHNPPELHIPPWLSEDEQRQHIARAQAAQGGAPTPTPAQTALDDARERKRARRQADRDRDLAKRSDPESQQ